MSTSNVIAWRGFEFEMPAEWEMVGFSRDMPKGRCRFADRYSQRLDFSWRTVDGAPDLRRMSRDYGSRLATDFGMRKVRQVTTGPWEGSFGGNEHLGISRHISYSPESKLIVEMVLHWPGGRDSEMEDRILRSFHEDTDHVVGDKKMRHWRAFGMDMLVSDDLQFRECRSQPALVEMTFGHKKNIGSQEFFSRTGLVKKWLKGTVGEWQATKVPHLLRKPSTGSRKVGGHTVFEYDGEISVKTRIPAIKKTGRFFSDAWVCPHNGRLYYGHILGAPNGRGKRERIAGRRYNCCDEMREIQH